MTCSGDYRLRQNISRRQVLTRLAVGGIASSTAATIMGSRNQNADNLIDAHVHVWTPDTSRYPLSQGYSLSDMQPPSFTPEQLMAHAAPCGVSRVVLIQMSYYGFDNSYMLDVIAAHPKAYRGVAIVNETDAPGRHMKQLAAKGVTGFRIQPGDRTPDTWFSGDGMKQMWTVGADENLAMCHLINPEYLPGVADMCRKFPRTPVVIDHFARIGIDGMIRETDLDALCRLADHPQVSVKVSAYYALGKKAAPYHDLGPMIRRLRDCFGADRLMWASDCPFQVEGGHSYAASIDLIRTGLSFLTDADRTALLRGTAERVFFRA